MDCKANAHSARITAFPLQALRSACLLPRSGDSMDRRTASGTAAVGMEAITRQGQTEVKKGLDPRGARRGAEFTASFGSGRDKRKDQESFLVFFFSQKAFKLPFRNSIGSTYITREWFWLGWTARNLILIVEMCCTTRILVGCYSHNFDYIRVLSLPSNLHKYLKNKYLLTSHAPTRPYLGLRCAGEPNQ